jgi:hypothetical protein
MLMKLNEMQHYKFLENDQFEFIIAHASKTALEAAIAFDESWTFIYGHNALINIADVHTRLKEMENKKQDEHRI